MNNKFEQTQERYSNMFPIAIEMLDECQKNKNGILEAKLNAYCKIFQWMYERGELTGNQWNTVNDKIISKWESYKQGVKDAYEYDCHVSESVDDDKITVTEENKSIARTRLKSNEIIPNRNHVQDFAYTLRNAELSKDENKTMIDKFFSSITEDDNQWYTNFLWNECLHNFGLEYKFPHVTEDELTGVKYDDKIQTNHETFTAQRQLNTDAVNQEFKDKIRKIAKAIIKTPYEEFDKIEGTDRFNPDKTPIKWLWPLYSEMIKTDSQGEKDHVADYLIRMTCKYFGEHHDCDGMIEAIYKFSIPTEKLKENINNFNNSNDII